jgi:hypothetical protein
MKSRLKADEMCATVSERVTTVINRGGIYLMSVGEA